jgi:site-specific DNA-methyltransferase (adenine-specific)
MKELNGGKQMTDVWRLPAIAKWEKSCGKHPTQKPLGLLARIIEASTEPHAWILDPFSGSGTTGIAASLLGRRYLGLEKEEKYLSMSKARREELERLDTRDNYLERLAKSGAILPVNDMFAMEPIKSSYNVPWMDE